MLGLFSKYLLIGLSAMVLVAGAQQGLFNKQNTDLALADDHGPIVLNQPLCLDDDAGRSHAYWVTRYQDGFEEKEGPRELCGCRGGESLQGGQCVPVNPHGSIVLNQPLCLDDDAGRSHAYWVTRYQDGFEEKEGPRELCGCRGGESLQGGQCVTPGGGGSGGGSGGSQPVRNDECTDTNTPQTDTCHDAMGTGRKYCTWTAEGNKWSACRIESCDDGNRAPPSCVEVLVSPGNANSPWQCERDIAAGRATCTDNSTFCEDTNQPGQSPASVIFLRRNGRCNPSLQEKDQYGCVYDQQQLQYQNFACGGQAQPPAPGPSTEMVTTCKNQTITKSQLDAELRAAGYGGPWDTGSALAAYNRVACPQGGTAQKVTCYICDTSRAAGDQRRMFGNANSWDSCNGVNGGVGNPSTDSSQAICATPQTCFVCDNTGFADGQGRWRVDGNGCPASPPVCQADNSATFAGCTGATAGSICQTAQQCNFQRCIVPNPVCGVMNNGTDNCGRACQLPGPTCGCTPDGSCTVSTPLACGQVNVGVDNCKNVCVRQSASCPTPPQGGNVTVNPVFNNNPVNTFNPVNTVTVNNPAPAIITAQAAPATFGNVGVGTSVIYTQGIQATQLPKTGLPVLAWSALAFVPAGFRMRRFSKVKGALENHPSYIWEDRQFKA